MTSREMKQDELIAQRDKLRAALVGLVGESDPQRLAEVEAIMYMAQVSAKDKAAMINAIHALIETAA